MTPCRLTEIGHLLYGHGWVNPLARALNINRRTMLAFKSDDQDIPVGVASDLANLCERRAVELTEAAAILREMQR